MAIVVASNSATALAGRAVVVRATRVNSRWPSRRLTA
jgi:hypothetical protein